MSSNRVAAAAIVVGTLAGYVTMLFHPTGADVARTAASGGANTLAMAVHLLAWLGQGVTLAGALAITRILWLQRELSIGAYVFFALAACAALVAAAASGFIGPRVVAGIAAADAATSASMTALMRYTWYINQTFSMMYVLFTSISILLWSIAALRTAALPRMLASYGVVVGMGLMVAVILRVLPLDVHGFGLVILTQGVWMLWTASRLWYEPDELRLP